MANFLFKKSYLLKNFKEIPFDSLWNNKGIFTTIRVIGKPKKYLFIDEHLINLNKSIKVLSINFKIDLVIINKLVSKYFVKNIYYDHLFRIAISKNKISFSLRKRNNIKNSIRGILVAYQRSLPELKNLYYKKILSLLDSINQNTEEIILYKNKLILEGATTNILFIKGNNIYIPKKGYYFGTTLKFLLKKTNKKIIKKNIEIVHLKIFDEILLVGAGKGVVNIKSIPQIKWFRKKMTVYNEFNKIYKFYIGKQIATK